MFSRSHIEKSKIAFFPIGSTEQHGPHLPVTTDSIIATSITKELSKFFNDVYVLPCMPFSMSFEHAAFSGTISLRTVSLECVVRDVVKSLSEQYLPCVIINFHFGNNALSNFVQELSHDGYKVMLTPSARLLAKAYADAGISNTPSQDMHAGEAETSLLLHLCPELVNLSKVVDIDVPDRPLLNTVGFKGYTSSGVIGFPSLASAQKGKKLVKSLTSLISKDIGDFINGL